MKKNILILFILLGFSAMVFGASSEKQFNKSSNNVSSSQEELNLSSITRTVTGVLSSNKGENGKKQVTYFLIQNEGSKSEVSIKLELSFMQKRNISKYVGQTITLSGKITELSPWNKMMKVQKIVK